VDWLSDVWQADDVGGAWRGLERRGGQVTKEFSWRRGDVEKKKKIGNKRKKKKVMTSVWCSRKQWDKHSMVKYESRTVKEVRKGTEQMVSVIDAVTSRWKSSTLTWKNVTHNSDSALAIWNPTLYLFIVLVVKRAIFYIPSLDRFGFEWTFSP
jgi:hypothetical protein